MKKREPMALKEKTRKIKMMMKRRTLKNIRSLPLNPNPNLKERIKRVRQRQKKSLSASSNDLFLCICNQINSIYHQYKYENQTMEFLVSNLLRKVSSKNAERTIKTI